MNPLETAKKIKSMEIRGALEIALAAVESLRDYTKGYRGSTFIRDLEKQASLLKKSRPTAVSLPNAVDYVLYLAKHHDRQELPELIDKFMKEQREALFKLSKIGAKRIEDGDIILTHCNSTAVLETIREAAKTKRIHVICTETRPRNQGYLTASYLAKHKIPVTLILDSAVRSAIEHFGVKKILIGADTVAANGAVANKIGTSQIASIAHEFNIPFMVATETIKFSPQTFLGNLIEIEEREHTEIRPKMRGVTMWNPAFDFTPPEYIDIIITEDGIISPHMAYTILKEKFGWELK